DYHLVMLEDISARRAAETVAAANLQMLERLDRVKTQFLTRVSHEFRTALVGIQGFSEFIRDSDVLDVNDVKAFANDIYDDAQRLDKSLGEMLELDNAKGGRAGLDVAETDLNSLLSDAAEKIQTRTSQHIITSDLELLPLVMADRELLSHVVTSLLVRAVEYSTAGGAIVLSAPRDDVYVEVSVKDRRESVASDMEAQLLGRADEGEERLGVQLLGGEVGLPMVRQIVEMHGGRLWFEAGAQTVWHFTIPIGVAGTSAAPPLSADQQLAGPVVGSVSRIDV